VLLDTVSGLDDAVARQILRLRILSDAILVTDSIQRLSTLFRSILDVSSPIGDLVGRTFSTIRTITDTAFLSEVANRALTLPRQAQDAISNGDLLDYARIFIRSVSELALGTDLIVRMNAVSRTLLESIPTTVISLIAQVFTALSRRIRTKGDPGILRTADSGRDADVISPQNQGVINMSTQVDVSPSTRPTFGVKTNSSKRGAKNPNR
jgi:hypothetical protein